MTLQFDVTDLNDAIEKNDLIDAPVADILALAPGDDWVELADVVERLWQHIYEQNGGFCDVLFSQFVTQVLAESYNRGIRSAARYLSVPAYDLEHGAAEMIDGDREPLTGITIPKVECQ